ncbi:MAG: hypothetical protein AB7T37_13020 [Dehalococcoidia bacterium]
MVHDRIMSGRWILVWNLGGSITSAALKIDCAGKPHRQPALTRAEGEEPFLSGVVVEETLRELCYAGGCGWVLAGNEEIHDEGIESHRR